METMDGIPRQDSFIYFTHSTLDQRASRTSEQSSSSWPVRTPTNLSKKPRQHGREILIVVENDLVKLCRAREWTSVIRRCRSNPEEAAPKQVADGDSLNRYCTNSLKLGVDGKFFEFDRNETIHYDTPLGIACASNQLGTDVLKEVIVSLVMACPFQVRASQSIPGNTPLRDAILNPRCSSFVLRALLDAEIMCRQSGWEGKSALAKKDRNGHRPVDHIIMALQLGFSNSSIDMFEQYIDHEAFQTASGSEKEDVECSPLIKLLTARPLPGVTTLQDHSWLEILLRCVILLLERDSSSLKSMSKLTGCSVVHIALRNYGHYAPLINTLVSRPDALTLMAHRNRFGDLPVHVACSVGVPYDVLKTIVEATIGAVPVDKDTPFRTHPLLWSNNGSGYTAADLECVRQLESGHGLDTVRSFYALEPSGMKQHFRKQDEYYQFLFREAIDRVLLQDSQSVSSGFKHTFGTLLDRISLLVRDTTFSARTDRTLLHDVCTFSSPGGPTLPCPLVRLFLSLCKHDLLLRDQFGRIPFHYLVQHRGGEDSANHWGRWKHHVFLYLQLEPRALRVATLEGRLPLHILLDHSTNDVVVHEMLARFPDSVDIPDPKTNLMPFQLAAQNTCAELDAIFFLLRQSPSQCHLLR